MTERLRGVDLPRPEPAADKGPLDTRFYDLVEARVRRVFVDNPVYASLFGIHTEDHRLGDASRDAVLQEIAADRAHLAAVVSLDPDGLSPEARFERDLEVHNLRLSLFEADEVRSWERAGTAAGVIGDALFLLFARGAKPAHRAPGAHHRSPRGGPRVPRRLAIPARRHAGPDLAGGRGALRQGPARACSATCSRRPRRRSPPAELARMRRAIATANTCLDDYGGWLREGLARATDDWPLGREPYDELVRLRAFGDLDTDTILRIGEEQLVTSLEARRAAARELDPDADVHTVIDRLKSDHPATFAGGAGRLPRRDAPGPRPHHRARHRDDPARRARRGDRDARVPAHGDAVRGVLRAGPVRRRQASRCTSSRPMSTATRTRCASTTGPRSRTRASTRRIRVITSSSRSPLATRASPGCSPTRPSSSRAGACTASR